MSGGELAGRDIERVSIVGLGLIGGSLARDLAARGVSVSAYDADERQLAAALASGVVTRALDETLSGAAGSDVIVVAVPVDRAVGVLERVAPHAARASLITDVGSTKSGVVAGASALGLGAQFVGSHPMAGDHRSGWDASRGGLFAGARVYLCPSSEAPTSTVDAAAHFWRSLGAIPASMRPEEHDRHLAWTSHLPHIISTVLALTLANGGVRRDDLGPGGRDMTRLAGSSPEMWAAIARENVDEIAAALDAAETELTGFREVLRRAHATDLPERFSAARAWFDA